MKSIIKIFPILAVLFTANTVSAQSEGNGFSVSNSGEKSFFFTVEDKDANELQVRLLDEHGATLFAEQVYDASNFERFYNLSELPTGEYFLLVAGGSKTKIQPITVKSDDLAIDTRLVETVSKSAIHLQN